jgi:hypothetical protein
MKVELSRNEPPPSQRREKAIKVKIQAYLKGPSPFLQKLLGRKIEPDTVDESELPEGILTVLADKPQQALAAVLRCRPFRYRQIAVLIGVSPDRVRQLEIRAADTLRRASRFRQLSRFIPGWQNALRLRPDNGMSLLPGETFPLKFGPKRKLHIRENMSASKAKRSSQEPFLPTKKKSNDQLPSSRQKTLSSAKPR